MWASAGAIGQLRGCCVRSVSAGEGRGAKSAPGGRQEGGAEGDAEGARRSWTAGRGCHAGATHPAHGRATRHDGGVGGGGTADSSLCPAALTNRRLFHFKLYPFSASQPQLASVRISYATPTP
jgi:hypothetical protein